MTDQQTALPDNVVRDALQTWNTSIVESGNDFTRMKATLTAIIPQLMRLSVIEAATSDAAKTNQLKLNRRYKKLIRRCSQLNNALIKAKATKPVDVAAALEFGLLNEAKELALTAIKRMRAAHVPCQDLLMQTEAFVRNINASIRALSAEPAQGEQWWPIELVGDKERLITIGSYNAKGVWCAEVWHTKYLRDQQVKSADGFFMNAPHLEWVPTHFMELPAAPTTEAGR